VSFTPRTRDEIATSYLDDLSARYLALGQRLLTIVGSRDRLQAEALAVELEAIEAQAASVALNILPDTADTESLNRHGEVEGIAREAAVAALHTLSITGGPVSTTTALSGQSLLTSTGVAFSLVDENGAAVTSLTTNGSGTVTTPATLRARCTTVGTDGNLAASSTLTWSSAPTGYASSTVTVSGTVTNGAPEESDSAYAARIIARRQNRPASGNVEDWRDWCKSVTGVEEAYVYPLMDPSGTTNTLGCVTVVCVGPAQGDSTTNTRILDSDAIDIVAGFLEGTNDAEGNTVSNGVQLRPVTIREDDYTIAAATADEEDVELVLVNNAANAFAFTSPTRLARVGSTTTSLTVAGDYSALSGKAVLLHVGTTNARGGFVSATITTAVFGGVNTVLTFAAVASAPTNDFAGYALYPAPANWAEVRDAVFAHFDALGPGDASSPSRRYPAEDVQARATFYRNGLIRDVMSVSGVLNATIPSTPAADVTPAAKAIVTLRQLVIRQ
jgi:uncharacterized phage protein gp47/JayE